MKSVQKRALTMALIFLPVSLLSMLAMGRAFRQQVVIKPETLPEHVITSHAGSWSSRPVPLTDSELSILDSPAASQRVYVNDASNAQVQILLLQVDNTQNAHDPRLCMTGSGFTDGGVKSIPAPWNPINNVSLDIFRKEGSSASMYYWLQTADGTIPDMSSGLKMKGIVEAIKGRSVRGVAVRVILFGGDDADTSVKPAEELWEQISNDIDLDRLVRQMN